MGQRTFVAQPAISNHRISRAAGSTWCESAPCRAEAGALWWKLCQLSPNDTTASGATFPLRSFVTNGLRPQRWHTELMLQVTWCSRNMRTRPAQRNAPNAPAKRPEHEPTNEERYRKRADRQHREEPVDDDQTLVTEKIGCEALRVCRISREQPTDVRPQETSQSSLRIPSRNDTENVGHRVGR